MHAWSHTMNPIHTMNSLFVEIIIYPTFLLGIACNSTPPLAHTNTFLMEELQEGTKKKLVMYLGVKSSLDHTKMLGKGKPKLYGISAY